MFRPCSASAWFDAGRYGTRWTAIRSFSIGELELTVLAGTTPPKGRRGPHRASSDLSPEEPLAIPSKAISAGEFIRQLGIKKHTDQILAFGYFLEKYQGQPSFGAADINNLYYEAKLESSNTSQMIIYNIRAGLMMEAKGEKKGKKKYTLTQNGERKIKERLESASAPAAK